MTDTTYAAGWYPDVNAPGTDRYYDGTTWTDQTRATVPPGAPVAAVATPVDAPADAAAVAPKKPRNILGLVALAVSAVGFIFACIPGALIVGWVLLPIGFILGIVALFQKDKPKWQGLTAIILSVIGTIVGVVVFISLAAGAVSDAVEPAVTSDGGFSQDSQRPDPDEEAAEPAAAAPKDLALGEQAWGMDSSGYGWYAIEVTNPNADYVFTSFAAIEVEAYDAAGVLLDTDSSYGTILQGTSMYVGRFLDIGAGVIDHIEVRGPVASSATHSPQAETGSFTMGAITTGSEYDRMTINGTVTSNFSEDQDMVRIDLVARNAAGQIVGVEYAYTDRVPAAGTAAWNVSFWEVPLDSQVTAFAHL
ncbi:DUF2510 domain-containing protein [Microbacterium sp. LMI12-1-1.1]|uniref:DUF2510 domain-containing protein n=1 Tax=Microbacterium sp. LMI12-1-1.1 TaxID=3135225 RepID=UPI00344A8B57